MALSGTAMVAYCLDSTLEPTLELLRSIFRDRSSKGAVVPVSCNEACTATAFPNVYRNIEVRLEQGHTGIQMRRMLECFSDGADNDIVLVVDQ